MIYKNDPAIIFQNALERTQGCLFCSPIKGMTLFETVNFRVLMDTFPISAGHIMISTKKHYGSAGEVPLELYQEFTELKNRLANWAKAATGKVIFYEHGRFGSCSKSAPNGIKCEHFHLHCIPINVCIHSELQKKYKFIDINNYERIQSLFYEYGSYLFFENSSHQMTFYVADDDNVAPHLLRTLVCNAIKMPSLANWEEYKDLELFLESYEFTKGMRK